MWNQESRCTSGRRAHLAEGTTSSKALHSGLEGGSSTRGIGKVHREVFLEFRAPRGWDASGGRTALYQVQRAPG